MHQFCKTRVIKSTEVFTISEDAKRQTFWGPSSAHRNATEVSNPRIGEFLSGLSAHIAEKKISQAEVCQKSIFCKKRRFLGSKSEKIKNAFFCTIHEF